MIEVLELTNFMSVAYAKHTFSPGLNVLRGANEAGKSTRFLAVAYALWGARALPDSLDDTVTWGHPVSSLKVCLQFTLNGTIYTIVRTRAGAALAGSDNTLSEGQAEVTAQVERLTGASAATGMMTLLTNQGSLQASLDSASLIEKLSNTSLVDRLIAAVGEAYPSGNTKQLEIELNKEILQPVENSADEAKAGERCEVALALAQGRQIDAEAKLKALEPEIAAASALLAQRVEVERKVKDLRGRLKPRLPEPLRPAEPRTLEELQELRAEAEGQTQKRKAKVVFDGLTVVCLSGSLDWRKGQLEVAKRTYQTLSSNLAQLTAQRADIKATGIWVDSCALCGKLLTDVPEVVQVNVKVKAALLQINCEIAAQTKSVAACRLEIETLEKLIGHAEVVTAKLPLLSDYCSIDLEYTPPKVLWTAGPVTEPSVVNFDKLITELYANRAWYDKALAEVTAHNQQRAAIEQELAYLAIPPTAEAEDIMADAKYLREVLAAETGGVRVAQLALTEARHALDKARAVYKAQMDAYIEAVSARELLRNLLADYRETNALIAKLKSLKPIISKSLWSLVLLSVSTVFSQLRGIQSVVTRDADGFLIDGKRARSYSGSTKDILGLAIRITLQKTFLPNLSFCLLDEPAAAADAVREEAMLAALSRVDFAQVILVTHSDLADTFAQSVHVL